MILKAGTYKFKSALNPYPHTGDIDLRFNSIFTIDIVSDIIHANATCSKISFEYAESEAFKVKYYVESTEPDISAILATSGNTLPTYLIVYENGSWLTSAYTNTVQTITLHEDTTVAEDFYAWFINSVEPNFYTITSKMQRLIETANATTNRNDTDIATAVDALIDGHRSKIPNAEGVKF